MWSQIWYTARVYWLGENVRESDWGKHRRQKHNWFEIEIIFNCTIQWVSDQWVSEWVINWMKKTFASVAQILKPLAYLVYLYINAQWWQVKQP